MAICIANVLINLSITHTTVSIKVIQSSGDLGVDGFRVESVRG